jgi:large subunit ribosomal protein L25
LEQYVINANVRSGAGHAAPRALRRSGRTPGILYGPETAPILLSVDAKELQLCMKKKASHPLLTLQIAGDSGASRAVMVKELQLHPVSRSPLHVDFYEVAMGRRIRVKVPVEVAGKPRGVEQGGMLQIVRRELEVSCLPKDIPECIRIDVTDLGLGDSIHVEDLTLASGIDIPHEVNFTVLSILSPKSAAGPETAEGAEEAAVAAKGEPAAEKAKA